MFVEKTDDRSHHSSSQSLLIEEITINLVNYHLLTLTNITTVVSSLACSALAYLLEANNGSRWIFNQCMRYYLYLTLLAESGLIQKRYATNKSKRGDKVSIN